MPKLQPPKRDQRPSQPVPQGGANTALSRYHGNSDRMDEQSQPNRHRAGLLDREVSHIPWHLVIHLSSKCRWRRLLTNTHCSSQPGSHRVDGVPPQKSLQRDWTHSGSTLRPEPMQDHGHRLDEVAGDPPHTHLPPQWILRNFTLHDKQCRYLRLQQCRDLLREVKSLLDTPPEEVPEGSRYLLQLDFSTLYNATFELQSHLVLAMKATRRAGQWIAQTVKHQ
jgi:hypothetical protein